ncbi:MAG: Gfo/Idh/MocA family oxidoreductase [Clostridia bacterium]|nr:Gfo/Idh/MocA family oxidoreductase [Clostridia bacterium]
MIIMFRIGILGSENSHALAFSQIFNGITPGFDAEFEDIEVVGTFGTDNKANQELLDKAGVKFIADKPEDLLGKVDAVMVTARDGKYHAEYARPFIEAGLPAFIDKPFTRCGEEAVALAKLAKDKGVPLVGGSSLKCCIETKRLAAYARAHKDKILTGSVVAPVSMHNDYGDFYFYSSHLAEISLMVFGYDPEWVTAVGSDKGVTATIHYENYDIANHFTEHMYQYWGSVITEGGIHTQGIDLDTAYAEECRSYARMLRTGKMAETYEELVQPVFYLNALEKAMKTGERVPVIRAEI